MKVVVVGAGSVGQAYGYHIAQAGAEITFLMRPGTGDRLADGLRLAPLNRPKSSRFTPIHFTDFQVCTEVAQGPADADQVWLCMPITGFHDEQLEAIAERWPKATIVSMMSSISLRQRMGAIFPVDRLVFGLIPMASMPTPRADLPIQAQGQAWWFPPLAKTTFSGPQATQVAALARRGGAPARTDADTTRANAVGASALIPMVAALELVDWSTAAYGGSEAAGLAARASGEIQRAIAKELGSAGPMALARHPWVSRSFLWLAQRGAPFDFEGFIQSHFGKVGAQTETMLEEWIELGRGQGLVMDATATLLERLRAIRS